MKYYVFIQIKPNYLFVSMISNYQKSWPVKTSILELLLLQLRHKCTFLQKFCPKRGVNTRKKLKNENISSGVNSLTLIWYSFMYYTYMFNKIFVFVVIRYSNMAATAILNILLLSQMRKKIIMRNIVWQVLNKYQWSKIALIEMYDALWDRFWTKWRFWTIWAFSHIFA